MAKDIKILIGAVVFTFLLIIGFAFWQGSNLKTQQAQINKEVLGLEANPSFYDLGEIPINGGLVTKEYEIKNTSGKSLKLTKVGTSCMCTIASVEIGDKKTKFFGMEMHGDANPPVNLEIPKDSTAKVIVRFDPAAHGPEGVGYFDRIVWLYFPDGFKELKFNGTVVP